MIDKQDLREMFADAVASLLLLVIFLPIVKILDQATLI